MLKNDVVGFPKAVVKLGMVKDLAQSQLWQSG